jgi:GT2 family glycosyltransferase
VLNKLLGIGKCADADHADIIIPVHDHTPSTIDCLHSVWQCTPGPYHVIVIDNSSDDRTPAIMQELAASGMPLTIIRNEGGGSDIRGVNRGLRASTGSFAVLLDGSITVTSGWLRHLIQVAESDERIGIAGPIVLNSACLPHSVVGDSDLDDDHGKAAPGPESGRENPPGPRNWDCQHLEGSCLLIRRTVIETIGYLDEASASLQHANADYCLRARKAGFRTVCSPYVEARRGRTVRVPIGERRPVRSQD